MLADSEEKAEQARSMQQELMQALREQEIKAVEAKQKALTAQRLLAENDKNAEAVGDGLFETEIDHE